MIFQANLQQLLSGSNKVDGVEFVNILSKINRSLQVIMNDEKGNQNLRASLQCIEADKTLF